MRIGDLLIYYPVNITRIFYNHIRKLLYKLTLGFQSGLLQYVIITQQKQMGISNN